MKITIFGGTGGTGLLLIEKALTAGHTVTVFARKPSKIRLQNNNLKIIDGELSNSERIELAILGADAVISVLGPTGKSKRLAISNGTKNIIAGMEKHGVKRLIATATPSYKVKDDKFQLGFAIGALLVKSMLKDTYQDIVETGTVISKSKLNWTIVRLPMLSILK